MQTRSRPPFEDAELVFEEVFQHTPVGVVLSDLHGSIIDLNQALCAMVGFTRSELIGRKLTDISHPEDQEDIQARMKSMREGRSGPYVASRRYVSRNGDIVHAKVSVSVIHSRTGEPVCGIGFIEDITARVAVETALRQSELRFRRVIEDQTDMIVRCLPDGTRTFVNDAYCRYNGKTAEELVGTSFFPLIPGEDRERVRAKYAAFTPDSPVLTEQHWAIGPGGALRWHEWTDRAFFDERGQVVEIQAVGRDLTEQHEAQQRLIESEERHRGFFANLPVSAWENDWTGIMADLRARGIGSAEALRDALREDPQRFYEIGRHGNVTSVNQAALEMAGVESLEEFRTWLLTAWTQESALRFGLALAPVIFEDRKSITDEYTMIRANGEPLEVLFRVGRSARWGEHWMMSPVAVDITDRKRIEREASRHRDQLERADKMISLGFLIAGVTHEINNPNHTIGLNAPLMRDTWRDAASLLDRLGAAEGNLRVGNMPWKDARTEMTAMIDDIQHASERIRNIVAELRSFALDHDPRERRTVSLNKVVSNALRLLGKHISRATLRFTLHLSNENPSVNANASRLEQVVVNLVLNACQALENKEQAISIESGTDGGRAFIVVRDEGRGIAADDLAHIRTPFFTTKRAEGGTGLGIPVADRIAVEQGGELTFQSATGKGTAATLWLPLDDR